MADESDQFLCRDIHSEEARFSRETASEWESFLALSVDELGALRDFLRGEWVYRGGSAGAVPHRPHLIAPFTVRLGDLTFDLRLQAIGEFGRSRVGLNHDGWKSTDIYRYRPMVFVTAYSSPPVLQQMRLCVMSMREFGAYDGPILLMTDVSELAIRALFAEAGDDPGEIVVLNLPAKDFVGFVCSKYSIIDYEQFEGFQPLLYLDPDIVIDMPMEPMLARIASSGRICAPAEGWNQVHHHIPVGASLMRMDDIECRFLAGLNGGTIGFPALDVPGVKEVIEKIRRTIACVGRHFGRTFNRWADQEAMNYIAVKTDTFDSVTLTPFVVHYLPQSEQLGGRRGLVHFWGRSSAAKVDAMTEYAEQLRQDPRGVPDMSRKQAGQDHGPVLFSTNELGRSMPIMDGLRIQDGNDG